MCALHNELHPHEWDHIGHGTHICSIFNGKDDQFAPIAPFFSEGFSKHEKCVYIFDQNTPEEISSRISDDDAATLREKLDIVPYQEMYVKDGFFDPDNMITLLEKAVKTSLEEGYTGLRAAGEMSWVFSSDTPAEKFLEYEQKLNIFFPENKVIGVCQFDEEKFPPELLIEMIRMHPYVLIHGQLYENKFFYTDPRYEREHEKHFKADDYETILSIIKEETAPITE